MVLVKKLCGEVREIAKAANPEEREERRKEMEKVRSARLSGKMILNLTCIVFFRSSLTRPINGFHLYSLSCPGC